jgi:nucleotide-binding universal stress UspA family protein
MALASSSAPVVVGTDGSERARSALHWAAAEARLRHASLHVVHAWMPPYPINPQDLFADYTPLEEAERRMLDDLVGQLRAEVERPEGVLPILVTGDAVTALMEASADAQLLVVGSRGHGGFAGLLLGSVSHKCLHHAACPVAVVPPSWLSAPTRHRVVVGVDGSEGSRQALAWAVQEASWRGAQLDVVNAWVPADVLVPAGPAIVLDRDGTRAASQALLEEMTHTIGKAAEPATLHIELIPAAGGPAATLLDAARGADVLVVGARGVGGFRGLRLGSVSQQCVHHAPCPIVVVRGATGPAGSNGSALR